MKKKKKRGTVKKKVVRKIKKSSPKKKKSVRKGTKKKSSPKSIRKVSTSTPSKPSVPTEPKLGEVEDYFSKIGVIAFTVQSPLSVGNSIHVHGHTTDFTQKVESMQIEHQPIQTAKIGDPVGIKVDQKCRKGDAVYLAS